MSSSNSSSSAVALPAPLISRLLKETRQLSSQSTAGISCSAVGASGTEFHATILGPIDSPYAGGVFHLSVRIPLRYPFEPPNLTFLTRLHHPNIDSSGRICLDLLNAAPKGSWKPSVNILGLLTALQSLLQSPNPEDPLMHEISAQFKNNYPQFEREAKRQTACYANNQQQLEETVSTTATAAAAAASVAAASDSSRNTASNERESNPTAQQSAAASATAEQINDTATAAPKSKRSKH